MTSQVRRFVDGFSIHSPPSKCESTIENLQKIFHREPTKINVMFEVPMAHSDRAIYRHSTLGEYFNDVEVDVRYMIDEEIALSRDEQTFHFNTPAPRISSIFFAPRDGHLMVSCSLKSVDPTCSCSPSLRFLSQLSSEVGNFYKEWGVGRITLSVEISCSPTVD